MISGMLVSPRRENEIEPFCAELAGELWRNSGPQVNYPWSLPAQWRTFFNCTGEAYHKVF
jgi:hypothetical protein